MTAEKSTSRPALSPSEFNEALAIAVDHFRNKRFKSALAIYDDLTQHPAAPPSTQYDRAVVLRALGRHQDALKPLALFLASRRDDFKAWTNAGDSLRELGNNAAAIEMFKHALRLAPHEPEAVANTASAHHNLSKELIGAGEMGGALYHAEAAATLAPDDPEIIVGLAELQLMSGDFEHGWVNYEARHAKAAADAKQSS